MPVTVSGIEEGSVAERLGIAPGDILLRIGGHEIGDVFDYRFYMAEKNLRLEFLGASGAPYEKTARKGEYEDLGLLFDSYLMDEQRRCKNKCVFCFIDQLPPGLRKSLYFKDDDSRMSFLRGSYITLTNLAERDIDRILAMHLSPVNISVHTTNPALRVRMLGNPRAGEVLAYLPRLVAGGIRLNLQLVLCPGLNDGEELTRSLRELCALMPGVQSIALVPVGLTKYRGHLPALRLFTEAEARAVIAEADRFGGRMLQEHGRRVCYASDELYLAAKLPLPPRGFYEDFDQLENGVGMLALLMEEFREALGRIPAAPVNRRVSVATGRAAYPFLRGLAQLAMDRFAGLKAAVLPVENDFFGHAVTVAGLVTGSDLLGQLAGADLGEELLISASMLRYERDLFLDDVSLAQLSETLGVPVRPVENNGEALLAALLGEQAF